MDDSMRELLSELDRGRACSSEDRRTLLEAREHLADLVFNSEMHGGVKDKLNLC
ncbi:MAG: hypothetical protein Q4B54_07520 [Coriobacteriales bacterium]|nr:hypothetical protein [Coriobacteriales bacterium]